MTALDSIVGQARLASCDVVSLDRYIVCVCEDQAHAMRDRKIRRIWADGGWHEEPAWHHDRAAAVRDGTYMGGDWHIVLRPALTVTAPEEVV